MPSTQDFLPIKEIRDGVVILKNGGLRSIIAVSSVNLELKSQEEQDATIYQFQNFLNSLDFACQISLQSRKLNITSYLDKMKEIEKKEKKELLKIQVSEYIKFIEKIMDQGTIMTKNFFLTVPFSAMKLKKKKTRQEESEAKFQRDKSQLLQRSSFVMLGIKACGLEAAPLNSLELIELFWGIHHLTESETGYYPEIPPELIK